MKYAFYMKRPKEGDMNNGLVKMNTILLNGGVVCWGKLGKVKGFTEPLRNDGTPAVELGYINMLVEAPLIVYLRDKIKYRKCARIRKGWPEMRYPGV